MRAALSALKTTVRAPGALIFFALALLAFLLLLRIASKGLLSATAAALLFGESARPVIARLAVVSFGVVFVCALFGASFAAAFGDANPLQRLTRTPAYLSAAIASVCTMSLGWLGMLLWSLIASPSSGIGRIAVAAGVGLPAFILLISGYLAGMLAIATCASSSDRLGGLRTFLRAWFLLLANPQKTLAFGFGTTVILLPALSLISVASQSWTAEISAALPVYFLLALGLAFCIFIASGTLLAGFTRRPS